MSRFLIILLVLLFIMCFSIYNWWFQREKCKRLMDNEKKGLSPFNSPFAWGIYSVVSLLAILGIVTYTLLVMFQGIMEFNK